MHTLPKTFVSPCTKLLSKTHLQCTVALEVTRHASGYHVSLQYPLLLPSSRHPPSVTLMSVQFSLRTVAIPVYMLITRPCTSPSQGCGYRRSPPHPHGSVGYDTLVSPKKQSVASSPFLSILIPQCVVARYNYYLY